MKSLTAFCNFESICCKITKGFSVHNGSLGVPKNEKFKWCFCNFLPSNHSITRAYDFWGPFKYGRYGTETASTVVIDDMESRRTSLLLTTFVYPFVTTELSLMSTV